MDRIPVPSQTTDAPATESPSEADSPNRAARIARIKAAIENGTYETIDKLDSAFEKLFNELEWGDV